jgi:hypothetical protein
MKKAYQHISISPSFLLPIILFLSFSISEVFGYAKDIASKSNMEIIVEDTVISSKDCYAYDVVLKAYTADLCYKGTTDWAYLIINADSGDTIQYSWNYDPQPGQGVGGDENIDRLTNTNDASFKILNPIEKGNYKIVWHVSNQCGDEQTLEQNVRVVDKTPPVAVIFDTFDIFPENGPEIGDIKARTFDKGGCGEGCLSSFDNCTNKDELYFTFSPMLPRLGEDPNPNTTINEWVKQYLDYGFNCFDPLTGYYVSDPDNIKFCKGETHRWYPAQRSSSMVNNCNTLENTPSRNFKIYVWDEFALPEGTDDQNFGVGNCYVYFGTLEFFYYEISGRVLAYKNDLHAPEFIIELTHDKGKITTETDYNGNYKVEYPRTDFTVEAYNENGDWLYGITTLDIVKIQKYLLGLTKITDPYCIIAADINLDGKVTAADLHPMRKSILGINKFKKSWIGIKKGYVFQDPLNPFKELDKAKKYEFRYEDLNDSDLKADFTGIKIGKLSCDFISPRNDFKYNLVTDDIVIEKGKRTEIPIYAKDAATLDGMQFSIDLSRFSEFSIESGMIKISQEDYNILDNKYIFSYIDASGLKVQEKDVLFTLIIETDHDIQLSSALKFAENALAPEVYSGAGNEISEMQLEFRNTEFKVFEPFPNPFNEKTFIDFTLTEDANYNFVITDLSGQKVLDINGNGKKGLNTINLTKDNLQSRGIYLYKLNSGSNHKTGKLVFLDK